MKLSQYFKLKLIRAKFKLLSAISKKKAAKEAFKLFCTPPSRDIKELPALFEQAEQLGFAFEQYHIVGYRWNKGGNRKVLILHGFESTAVNFAAYIQPLIQKGYEVMAFDAPAHGRSSGKRITAIIYRDLIKHIHQQYGPVQSYMGHSFGGFALCLALAEMPHNEDYRIALVAPATLTSTAIDQFFVFLRLGNEVRRQFDKRIMTVGGHPVDWFSITRAMKNIRTKTLWIHDDKDQVTPLRDALKVKEENYPAVEFVITNGLGHSRIYRDTEVTRMIIAFL